MMLNNIPRLQNDGYKILEELADESPSLFLDGDAVELRNRIEERAKENGDLPYHAKDIELEVSLDPLNQLEQAGPDTDANYAPLVRQAVSGISPAQAAEDSFWTSINCFVLSPYIKVRWSTSSLKESNLSKFVKNHWLWNDRPRRSNASARLWWLFETAQRASRFSKYSAETLLENMADNVELYHQLTDRTYFAANPLLVATVYDIAIEKNRYLFDKPYPNELMKALNMRAGNISFDVFDYDELYEIVESCLPPKERGATD